MLLFTSDSTNVDTVKTYEIPQVVSFSGGISVAGEVVPAFYEQSSLDLLTMFPFVPYTYGFGQQSAVYGMGRNPQYTRIYLNGRPVHVHPLGYVNLAQLPLHFFDEISYGSSITGTELSAINFASRVNQYDHPYSLARFMFGSFGSNIYGMDLTRAITNDLGFYLSGQYYKTNGHRENTDAQTFSVYSNAYYNRFIPMRFDFFYVNNEYGFPGNTQQPFNGRQEDRSVDVSVTSGLDNTALTFFYDYAKMDYNDTANGESLKVRTDQYGALIARNDTIMGVILDYGAHAYLTALDGVEDWPTRLSEGGIWASAKLSMGRFFIKAGGRIDEANYYEAFLCPRAEFGLNLTESMYLHAAISQDVRLPSDFELWAPFNTLIPYFSIAGNGTLKPEYCWAKEFGFKDKRWMVNYYQLDFTNFITTIHWLMPEFFTYVNDNSRETSGIEGFVRYPLQLYNADSSAMMEFVFAGSFNALITGDSIPDVPANGARASFSIMRSTKRFSLGIALRSDYSGMTRNVYGAENAGFSVYSLAGLLKFLSLSCVARLNNIFDEEYSYVPYYPMPLRNFDVSVKWEFWD